MVEIIAGYKKNKPLAAKIASSIPPRRNSIEKQFLTRRNSPDWLPTNLEASPATGAWTKVRDSQAYEAGSAINDLRTQSDVTAGRARRQEFLSIYRR